MVALTGWKIGEAFHLLREAHEQLRNRPSLRSPGSTEPVAVRSVVVDPVDAADGHGRLHRLGVLHASQGSVTRRYDQSARRGVHFDHRRRGQEAEVRRGDRHGQRHAATRPSNGTGEVVRDVEEHVLPNPAGLESKSVEGISRETDVPRGRHGAEREELTTHIVRALADEHGVNEHVVRLHRGDRRTSFRFEVPRPIARSAGTRRRGNLGREHQQRRDEVKDGRFQTRPLRGQTAERASPFREIVHRPVNRVRISVASAGSTRSATQPRYAVAGASTSGPPSSFGSGCSAAITRFSSFFGLGRFAAP